MGDRPVRRVTPFSDRVHLGGDLLRREPPTPRAYPAGVDMRADLRRGGLFRHADDRAAALGDPEGPFLIRDAVASDPRHNRAYPLRRAADRAPGAAGSQKRWGVGNGEWGGGSEEWKITSSFPIPHSRFPIPHLTVCCPV